MNKGLNSGESGLQNGCLSGLRGGLSSPNSFKSGFMFKGENKINEGGTYGSTTVPFYGFFEYGWSAFILSPQNMSTQIRGIQLFSSGGGTLPYPYWNAVANPEGLPMKNQRIYIGHTSSSIFTTSPYEDLSDINVFDYILAKDYFDFRLLKDGYFEILFDVKFCYNGKSNIVIKWENRSGLGISGEPTFEGANITSKSAYGYQDTTYPTATLGSRSNYQPVIKLIS